MSTQRIPCMVAGARGYYWIDPISQKVYNAPDGGTCWKYPARQDGNAWLYGPDNGTVLLPAHRVEQATVAIHAPPPIGLRPDYIAVLEYDKKRAVEIAEAVQRYAAALHPIPESWLDELNELIERNQPTPETETIQ